MGLGADPAAPRGVPTVFAIPVSGTVYVQDVGADTLADSPMALVAGIDPNHAALGGLAIVLDEGPVGIGYGDSKGCARLLR